MKNFNRFTMQRNVVNGKMAKFAADICRFIADGFEDDYDRVFWCSSFSSTDYELLTYRFDTDYKERFVVHFNMNDFTIQVIAEDSKGKIIINKYEIGCFLQVTEG